VSSALDGFGNDAYCMSMTIQSNPIGERNNSEINALLSRLWTLDKNGHCCATDGSLDDESDDDVIVALSESIKMIQDMG
jgi:hypothetical protein